MLGTEERSCTTISLTAIVLVALVASSPVIAEEKSVNEEILEILRDNGTIDEQQYQDLKDRQQAEAEEAAKGTARDPLGYSFKYSNGLQFMRNDGQFKLKLGGRIQADFATIHTDSDLDDAVPRGDGEGTEFRRARLYMSGEMYDRVIFKAQYDFAGGDADFKDVYIGMKNLGPVGTVLVGHFKQPFGLEELTSSKYITFMERALPTIFDSSRDFGIGASNHVLGDRMTWAAGVFAPTNEFGDSFTNDTRFDLTARLTGLPWYAEEGRQLVHLGVSVNQQFRDDITLRYRQRPEAHLAKRYLDTGAFKTDNNTLLSFEAAWVQGPFSLQGEWKHAWINPSTAGADRSQIDGAYVQASWFLTGENRVYKTSSGAFGRVTPRRSFDPQNGGWGAFELAARYSWMDINDPDLNAAATGGGGGGKEQNVTAGINWYLFSNLRLTANYVYANVSNTGVQRVDDPGVPTFFPREGGDIHLFQARAQIEF